MSRRHTLTLLVVATIALPVAALAKSDPAVAAAVESLHTWQQTDGGFTNGFAEGSNMGATADAVLALVAAEEDPAAWTMSGGSPLDYLAGQTGNLSGPGEAAKVAMAVTVAGHDPRAFGGSDLVAVISAGYDPASGFFGGGPFDSALALLALTTADEPAPPGAVDGLLAARLDDGSYSFTGDTTPGAGDSNTTALAIQALVAVGAGEQTRPSIEYLRATQNEDGGWTYQKPSAFGEETDANSTALAIQALLAAGEDLTAWGDPVQALLNLQAPGGAFLFNRSTGTENVLATVQAIPALVGLSYADVAARGGELAPAQTAPSTGLALVVLAILAVVLTASLVLARRRG